MCQYEGRKGKGLQQMRWLEVIVDSMDMSLSTFQWRGKVKILPNLLLLQPL